MNKESFTLDNRKIEFNIPTVPNFISSKGTKNSISISEFTTDELREIGRIWTENLIERAFKQAEKRVDNEKSK